MNAYKTPTNRGRNAVAAHASEIMVSADGTRKAYGRHVKCAVANRRYEIVQAWRIAILVDGKWVTRSTGLHKEAAEQFING